MTPKETENLLASFLSARTALQAALDGDLRPAEAWIALDVLGAVFAEQDVCGIGRQDPNSVMQFSFRTQRPVKVTRFATTPTRVDELPVQVFVGTNYAYEGPLGRMTVLEACSPGVDVTLRLSMPQFTMLGVPL